ncbi:FAD binding domain-containing protein [Desulfoscipio gibsoniae]|uniref:Aerobic-type carbon monoxide dehydrogenase, middle subunit CoxM/CutM-like protein n=1 Tax=Desulfoscipio gibsoniae DSM 7213 TaxID=767817 RepID=R4KDL0_9FIRM|nr:xanthine dehydrogenase family protein subunit M [Desulfoscipio gibsoniae]AGL00669.1 aerobic-type carbon monoxide dehydrogenase, middle subunit CoxM/CutM-like protein [Desulfoscipio gibsoniae DSM 7213]
MFRRLRNFDYQEAETVDEAVGILYSCGGKAAVLAGGVGLIGDMKRGSKSPEVVVSIKKISDLDYIAKNESDFLRIGALTSIRTAELSPIIRAGYPALFDAVSQIASVQVKTMSTLVGNLCVATPASDIAPPLAALGAQLIISGPGKTRYVPLEHFYLGVGKTVLEPGELVTEVLVPSVLPGTHSAFLKIARTRADIAKVNVAVTIRVVDGICQEARIVLGSVAPTVVRAKTAESLILSNRLESKVIEKAAQAAAQEVRPITDIRSTEEYRKQMVAVLVRRALEKCCKNSGEVNTV